MYQMRALTWIHHVGSIFLKLESRILKFIYSTTFQERRFHLGKTSFLRRKKLSLCRPQCFRLAE